jgi:hypothetical protein
MHRYAAGASRSLSMKKIGGISPSRFFSGALLRLLQNDRGLGALQDIGCASPVLVS